MACAFVVGAAGAAAVQEGDSAATAKIEAVQASIRARDPKAAPALADSFASEPRAGVRAWILRGVAALDPVRGAALAATGLTDSQPLVRMAAADALAQSRGAAAVPELAAALAGETNAGVRHQLAFLLGSFKTAAARAALSQALADADPNVRIQAARSLQRHGTAAARTALKAAKADADPRVRGIANEP